MNKVEYQIRSARPDEYKEVGTLMVNVYSQLAGFPKQDEQPKYYHMLANIGNLTADPETKLLIAVSSKGTVSGGVVYFGNMKHYGSGGIATKAQNASGFRLLAVDPAVRGKGLGKLLSTACIAEAQRNKHHQVIIHSTKAMRIAWKMYESMGFQRFQDLDFMQGDLPVYGFRLFL